MHLKYDLWFIIGKEDLQMANVASTTLKPNDVNIDGQKLMLQITNKRRKDDMLRAKPSATL